MNGKKINRASGGENTKKQKINYASGGSLFAKSPAKILKWRLAQSSALSVIPVCSWAGIQRQPQLITFPFPSLCLDFCHFLIYAFTLLNFRHHNCIR
ncbi:hypothetical protein [Desulfatibacillum alkenivorans]|jgi:hypothetical protein|uniref:hypothetical protein n=1 Tax=Desulfatibacillum alkenivorans TaxID=259354 RepID=UPI0009365E00|nr:hypothetical protein [Desulfatibacillum alkenivorans]